MNEKSDLASQVISTMDHFKRIIDICRNLLVGNVVKEERTCQYAIVRIYSKVIVTSCAIYTLLFNGYPDNSMALSRQLYESLVITSVLLKGEQNGDNELLDRFFDAPTIASLKHDYATLTYLTKQRLNNQQATSSLKSIEEELQFYLKKYQKTKYHDFSDYWWSDCNSFSDLTKKSDFPKLYFYSLLSDKVHMNALGTFHYLDKSEPGILLGNTDHGKERPLFYTALFLYCITSIIHERYPLLCPKTVIEHLKKLSDEASRCLEMAYSQLPTGF